MRAGRAVPAILCLGVLLQAQTATPDPAGVLERFAAARFRGSGTESIQALTSDAAGNVYVAGSTSSPDFPVKNASQPLIGEAVLMRSADGGATWQKVPIPQVRLLTMAPHPSDPQTLFGGAADGIYKSGDGGQTWRKVYAWSNPAVDDQISIVVDPANPRNAYFYAQFDVYDLVNSEGQLFGASADGGESWNALAAPSVVPDILGGAAALWVDPNGSGTIAVGPNLSRDHGNTWTGMSSLPPEATFGFIFNVPVPGHAGWIYAQGTGGGNLYLSKDWGNTWNQQPAPMAPSCGCLAVLEDLRFDPDLPGTYWADDETNIYTSNNAGMTWSVVSAPTIATATPLALVSRNCSGGALVEVMAGDEYGTISAVTASHNFGGSWLTPHLTGVVDVAAGPGCALYAVKTASSNAFVTKLSGSGAVLWSTFLGGSDLDMPVAIALDAQGNIYIAGVTASLDFPMTWPRVGPYGTSNAFAAAFDTKGNLLYSIVIGGEARDTVTGLAVDAGGEAHLAGWTLSNSFPTTPAAFAASAGQDNGFALKLGSGGAIIYSSYLPGFAPLNPRLLPTVAVAVEASGTALFGGPAGVLMRMSADGSTFTRTSSVGGAIYAMAWDAESNLYIAGQLGTPSSTVCEAGTNPAFLAKFQPDAVQQSYLTWIGSCQTRPVALEVSSGGEATLSLWTLSNTLPLMNPVLQQSLSCYAGAPAIVQLSADGSRYLFATYLDTCPQAPAIAVTPDGSVYTSVESYRYPPGSSGVAILRIPAVDPAGPAITGAFNAFSGEPASASTGMLLTITGANLAPGSNFLGITDANPLPTGLGTIRVLFDSIPAQLLQVTPGLITCVVPQAPPGATFVSMEVVRQSAGRPRGGLTDFAPEAGRTEAHPLALPMPIGNTFGLLTTAFPALPPAGVVPGTVRNADGSLNSAQNPAAAGSTVTLYATGLSGPGTIPLYVDPTQPVCFGFNCTPTPPVLGSAQPAPGLINAIYAVDLSIPAQATAGEHVISTESWPVTHGISIYVQ